jgi:hypothetical protein
MLRLDIIFFIECLLVLVTYFHFDDFMQIN